MIERTHTQYRNNQKKLFGVSKFNQKETKKLYQTHANGNDDDDDYDDELKLIRLVFIS